MQSFVGMDPSVAVAIDPNAAGSAYGPIRNAGCGAVALDPYSHPGGCAVASGYSSAIGGTRAPGPYSTFARDTNGNIAGGKTAIVLKLKNLQREVPNVNELWKFFCEINGQATNDPDVFDEAFLISFFETLDQALAPSGTVPPDGAVASSGAVAPAGAFSGGQVAPSNSKDLLVQRVKHVQRYDPVLKQQWINFCESHGYLKHDPSYLEESFINAFFEAAQMGTLPPVDLYAGWTESKKILVNRLKDLQRADFTAKQKWVKFCENHNQRQRDPAVHEEAFLASFFEALEKGDLADEFAHAQAAAAAAAHESGWDGGLSLGKEALVQRIKHIQRSDPVQKNKWIHFCETRGQKRHDPNVHDAEFLADYFKICNSTELPSDVNEKINMVQRVKEIQKKDAEGKQKWQDWCDAQQFGKHDPNLFTTDILQQFFDFYEGKLTHVQQAQQALQDQQAQPVPQDAAESMEGWYAYIKSQAELAQQLKQYQSSQLDQQQMQPQMQSMGSDTSGQLVGYDPNMFSMLQQQQQQQIQSMGAGTSTQLGGMDPNVLSMLQQQQQPQTLALDAGAGAIDPRLAAFDAGAGASAQLGVGLDLAAGASAQLAGIDPSLLSVLQALGQQQQEPQALLQQQ